MAAAVVTSLPTLQRFFLSILTWLNVQDKAQLWEDVKVHLLDEKEADTENDVLHSLQEMLHEEGSSLERLGLPMPTGATPTKEKNWHVAREMQRPENNYKCIRLGWRGDLLLQQCLWHLPQATRNRQRYFFEIGKLPRCHCHGQLATNG